MKKGLSVLLIAAALFGFYGGATSLNDVLASKDYWEEVGEKSTADMNKLEDGLNQLKDNEKAYLDGQKQLADGEKEFEKGKATLADGEAQYAQGLADYAAAPGKLADGRAKLDDAEDQLAEGRTQLAGLRKLIAGCNQIINGYQKWAPLERQYAGKEGRGALTGTIQAQYDDVSKLALFAGDKAGFTAAVNGLNANSSDDSIDTIAGYAATMLGEMPTIHTGAASAQKMAEGLSVADIKSFWGALCDKETANGMKMLVNAFAPAEIKASLIKAIDNAGTVSGEIAKNPSVDPAIIEEMCEVKAAREGMQGLCNQALPTLTKAATITDPQGNPKTAILYTGLNNFVDSFNALADAQYDMASGVQQIAYNVVNNATLKKAVIKEMGASAVGVLNLYSSEKTSPLFKANGATFEKFVAQMENIPGIIGVLTKARTLLTEALADGTKTYNAGLSEYNAGLAEYRQGLADYAAAPGKLADAEKQLTEGRAKLADAEKQLADGKKKLAEYEDGEQQVRDGLATLMATEADPGLESILDRRNGDDKFDDANGHLQLDEGLEAVDTGRGYQAESGELITKEVTNRAVGTAAGLGAAALAVLAAILSFLKKNKGAAVSAVLAAVAGGIGAGVGLSAGEYYSDIAGSTIGNTPFIAAAILAVVAAVFAIVHFTAKPEAK